MREDLENLKKQVSPMPRFPVEPLGLPELDRIERKKSPDLFIKVDKFDEISQNIRKLKETSEDINALLNVKSNAIRLLQQSMKNFENTLSEFEKNFTPTRFSPSFVREDEAIALREQVENLEKELARLKSELESKNI